jgi:hypothetical protein
VQKFSKSLRGARKNADQAIKTIRQKNIFKRSLVRNDDLYFRKRQENIRRKDREDELEASSVQGAPKTQGTILGKSTRGFLGRILDFLGILLIGWAITNLPRIIQGIEGLIKRISSVTGILSLFVDGIKFVLGGIGTIITNALSTLGNFDFLSQKKEIEAGVEGATTGLAASVNEINQASAQFQDPESFGLPDPPGFDLDNEQEKDNKEQAAKFDPQNRGQEPAELTQVKKELSDVADKQQEEEGEGEEVVEGDSDDIEGVKNDLEESLTADEGGTGGGGGSSPAAAGGSDVTDPRDELKKKQQEALSSSNKRNKRGRSRTRTRSSSFLETPETVENIKESVTPNNIGTGSNRGELVASVEITDEMKARALSPIKKEVNIETERKSKNKVMIIEKPMQTASSGGMTSSGSSSSSIPEVRDEQMLMKMQSTSTLKYT